MPTQYKIRGGVERLIIEKFIKSNNCIDWIANISRVLGKDSSGIEKIIKDLTKKNILKEIDCPQELIEKKGKGGAKPRTCYLLNYDMNPEWFVEIARPHLDTDDKETRLKFMKSRFVYNMIYYRKFIDWIIKEKIKFELENETKDALPFVFNSFPNTLRWVLYGDLSGIQKIVQKEEYEKGTFFSFLNFKIVEDMFNRTYIPQKDLAQIEYDFKTKFIFHRPKSPEDIEIDEIHNEISGGFSIEFKEVLKMKEDKKNK